MKKIHLSTFMDGEPLDAPSLSHLLADRELQQSWKRWHFIRGVMRKETALPINIDIASKVMAAIETADALPAAVQALPPHAKRPVLWHKKMWQSFRPWMAQASHIGIAASVALCIIVAYQSLDRPVDDDPAADTPAFNTLPLIGSASPVSFDVPQVNSPAETTKQEQRRFEASVLLRDFELQRRLFADELQSGPTSLNLDSTSENLPSKDTRAHQ